MSKDWLPLLIVNLSAGMLLITFGILADARSRFEWRRLIPGFLIVGAVLTLGGGLVAFDWPLSGPYNLVWGNTMLPFGLLFLGGALVLIAAWSPFSLGIPALLAGAIAVIMGVRIMMLALTLQPLWVGSAFAASGLAAVLIGLQLMFPNLRKSWIIKTPLLAALLGASTIWLALAAWDYWRFFITFADWIPK